jgi:hypothetical protein
MGRTCSTLEYIIFEKMLWEEMSLGNGMIILKWILKKCCQLVSSGSEYGPVS